MSTDVSAEPLAGELRALAGPPEGEVLSATQRVELARGLLERYPNATVGAMEDSGRFVPLPDELPLSAAHSAITGHTTALELVHAEDVSLVIDGWKAAFGRGAGASTSRPVDDPHGQLTMYCVDTRAEWGVFLLVAVRADGRPLSPSRGADDALAPRLAVTRKSRVADFVDVDDGFTAILGFRRGDVVAQRSLDYVHPDDQPRAIASWIDMLGRPDGTGRVRLRHQHADGRWIWFEVTNHNRLDDPGEGCVVAEMIDISDEMAAQESLRASQQLLARLTDALPVGVVQVDRDRQVVYANRRAAQILASRETSTLAGMFSAVATDDLPALDEAWATVLEGGADAELEVAVRHPRRSLLRCQVTLRPLSNGDDTTGAIACIDDITEPARLRAQLEFRATYDALTGCLNRASLLAELERALADARVEGTGTAAVFVDLDGFKAVNDTCGHTAGDRLLQQIAVQLGAAARRGDVVGRVGGDEFIVVGRGVGSAEQARAIGLRLAEGLAENVPPQTGHAAAASIGVAWAPADADESADQVIARADHAMYASKRAGDGRPVLG